MKYKFILQIVGKYFFRLSLYVGATIFAVFVLLGTPDRLKKVLLDTGAYDAFVPAVISDSARTSARAGGALSLSDPQVAKVITDSFSPVLLRYDAEQVIDAFYGWLQGRTARPEYVINLAPNIDLMAKGLSNLAMSRLQSLPVCAEHPTQIDPLKDTCRPEFYDFEEGRQSLAAQIRADNGMFEKLRYTVADLPKNAAGKTVAEQYAYAPLLFMWGRYAHWLLLCVAALGALMVVYSARKKRESYKFFGTEIMSSGVFLAFTPLIYLYIVPRLTGAGDAQGGGAASVIGRVVGALTKDFNILLVQIGVVMALVGLAIFLLERGTRPQSKYLKVAHKAGVATSEAPRQRRGGNALRAGAVPVQTSEGPRRTGKYQKDKRYRKNPRKTV